MVSTKMLSNFLCYIRHTCTLPVQEHTGTFYLKLGKHINFPGTYTFIVSLQTFEVQRSMKTKGGSIVSAYAFMIALRSELWGIMGQED